MAAPPGMKIIFHKELGESPPMHTIDANVACLQHSDEWSPEPWGASKGTKVNPVAAEDDADPEPAMRTNVDPATVDIPRNWRDLGHARIRSLSFKLGAPMTTKADEAEEIIERELQRRAAKGSGDPNVEHD